MFDYLVELRQDALEYLPDTCTILRKSSTATATGGEAESYAPVLTGVLVNAQQDQRATEQEVGGKLSVVTGWTLFFANGTDVRPTDRVQVGSRVFEVQGSNEGSTNEILREVRAVNVS